MIRTNDQNDLVLTPRAYAADSGRDIHFPLERCYICPSCGIIVKGAFRTEKTADHLLNLNPFHTADDLIRPEYKNQFIQLPQGVFQFFQDENHCGEGELQDRVKDANNTRCKFVKLYFEPNCTRLYNRFLKDLSKIECYGGYAAGTYRRDHPEFLKGVREVIGDRPESMQLFLAHHPYGRFVPDLVGRGPAAYLAMYRFEHTLLRSFYSQVIEGTHERIH